MNGLENIENVEDILERLVVLTADILELDPLSIPVDRPLTGIGGVDSLDLVDVVIGIERHFGILFDKAAPRAATLREAAELVQQALVRRAR